MSIDIKKNKSLIQSRYRPEIDGLRAFAVIAVIINHFNKEILPGGYLGVDFFFVISGFVITSSLYQRPSKNFKDFISGFYERRIKRLVPALSVFVLITSITISLFTAFPGIYLETGIYSLFGLSNLYLLKESTEYFAQSTELNVFTHTWSLGVEEQFYILFPFLIWFSGFGSQAKNGTRNLFLIVGALTIASLIGFLYLYPINQSAAYYLMPTRFWEMALGCLLFLGIQKRKSLERYLEMVPPMLVIALIIGVMYLPISFATASTFSVVVLTAILIASLKKGTASYKFFTNSRVVYIGLISYSLYLWHWGVLSISRWTIGIHWWSVPFQVALIFVLAVASHRWIETPLRYKIWSKKRFNTLILGVGILIVTASNLVIIGKFIPKKMIYLGEDLTDQWGLAKSFFIKEKKFACPYSYKGDLEKCLPSTNKKGRQLYLLGDSHAEHLLPAMGLIWEKTGIGINYYKIGSFPDDPTNSSEINFKRKKKNNIQIRNKEWEILLTKINPGDTVLLSSSWGNKFFEQYYIRKKDQYEKLKFYTKNGFQNRKLAIDLWKKSLEKIAIELSSKNANLILMLPLPIFSGHDSNIAWRDPICRDEWFRTSKPSACNDEGIPRKFLLSYFKDIRNNLISVEENSKNVTLIDPYKILCPAKYNFCSTSINNIRIFRDKTHLTRSGSLILGKYILEYTKNFSTDSFKF